MFRKILATVGIVGMGVTLGGCSDGEMVKTENAHGIVAYVPAGTMEHCAEEDGSGQPGEVVAPCVWNGGKNGKGRSIVHLGEGENAEVFFVTREGAQELLG